MQDGSKIEDEAGGTQNAATRPQQAGEGGTTRFGMEDGDNTDTPATGDGQREDEGD